MPIYDANNLAAFPTAAFADVLAGNEAFVETFADSGLTGQAAKGLAVITCMDSRISPLHLLGMQPGDVKIIRNAGARVTDDVMRTLILATYLLGVDRVLVMPHTDCRMASASESEIHSKIEAEFGINTRSFEFRTVDNQQDALITDVVRIRSHPALPKDLVVGGAIYDVHTGRITPVSA
ncbi:MAG: carbonic anhydrase [Candidatus Nanopelagicales bacterium]|nr:carbonic anhydrase [Candidatus Nanopelagicales bacterium]